MNSIAFIFPGQGSQSTGMGADIADRHPDARALYEKAQTILGFDLLEKCRFGPDEALRETDVAQPALFVSGVAAAKVLRAAGIAPAAVAGHSVGEYAALVDAGVFSFESGLELVRERSRLMKEAGEKNPGTMAAILGLSPEACEAVCGEASALGVCVPVNFNSPEQIVIAGVRPAVERASALAQERGAKRVIPLNVAGAFHSPLMRDAADAMARRLSSTEFSKPSAPVAMNVSGQLVEDAVAVRTSLERQLDSAVQWVKTIQSMKAAGVTKFVECGAGRVLSGLVRRVDKQLSVFSTETDEAVQEAARALEQVRRESV